MHRLSPLIVRQIRRPGRPVAEWGADGEAETSELIEDVKLFAIGWLGGLVFFGTLLL